MTQQRQIGIMGGTGVYELEGIQIIKEHSIETPFGRPSSPVIEAVLNDVKFFFIPRHGKNHNVLPHEVNYRANIFALKQFHVKYLIAVSAVGSLKEKIPPCSFFLPDQFIDWTKGGRERSFFGKGIVAHVSTAKPINLQLQDLMASACQQAEVTYSKNGTYICIEGPQFSSKAESAIYRSFGASVIGMTNVPEAYLALEAGMAFATIAMVTDYDCWKEEHCTVDEIMKVMKTNNIDVQKILKVLLPLLNENLFDFKPENENTVLTPLDKLSNEQKIIVETLMS